MAAGSLADEGCPKELAALVERGLLDDLVRPQQDGLRNGQAECLRRLEVNHQVELRRLQSVGKSS
jgi:hypothetical protein